MSEIDLMSTINQMSISKPAGNDNMRIRDIKVKIHKLISVVMKLINDI